VKTCVINLSRQPGVIWAADRILLLAPSGLSDQPTRVAPREPDSVP
jgi:hypothetical protein